MTRKMLFGCFQNTLISFFVGRIKWDFLAVVSKFRLSVFSLHSALLSRLERGSDIGIKDKS